MMEPVPPVFGPWIDKQIGDHGGSAGVLRGGKMTTATNARRV